MLMCPVFGAVFVMFWSLQGTAPEIVEAMRAGAIALAVFGLLIFLGIFISAFREPEEKAYRLQFVLGGVLCLAFLVTFDVFSADLVRSFVEGKGLLICTSQAQGCY